MSVKDDGSDGIRDAGAKRAEASLIAETADLSASLRFGRGGQPGIRVFYAPIAWDENPRGLRIEPRGRPLLWRLGEGVMRRW
jgi:hypothetical protein